MFSSELWNKPAGGGGGGGFYSHQISKSFRWDSGYLKRTPGSAGNRQIWTFSCWMKQSGTITNSQGDMAILNAGSSGNQDTRFRMYFNEQKLRSSSNEANYNVSPGLYRDPSAWMHIVWKLTGGISYQYVNGVLITNESVSGNVAINNNVEHTMGVYAGYETASRFKGYMAEVVFIDGTALDPTSFASEKNGVWIPDDVSELTFGSQGYHLDFANASAPGNDVSGNNNDWTNVSLATHDQTGDTPTFDSDSNSGNFATYNPLNKGTSNSLSEGNLQTSGSAGGNVSGTMAFLTGKWYWEQRAETVSAYGPTFGIGQLGLTGTANVAGGEYNIITWQTQAGQIYGGGGYPEGMGTITVTQTGVTALSSGDIMGFWLDLDNNKLWITKNGAFLNSGNPATGSNPQASWASTGTQPMTLTTQNVASGVGVLNAGQNPSFNGALTGGNIGTAKDKNGFGLFKYDPSSTDFIAMCSGNLPTADEIDPAKTDDNFPQKLFSPIIWTGNGATSRAITGLGFRPDWLWFKSRSSGFSHRLYDTTRSIASNGGKRLFSNTNGAEVNQTSGQDISAVGSDGFTLGASSNLYTNDTNSGGLQVNWSWRANGGTTSSGSGDLTSTQQVDPSGGFSIVKAVGSGSGDRTVSHGLSAAPTCILAKNLDAAYNWDTFWSKGLTATSYSLRLNTTDAQLSGRWGTVNSSIFTCKENYTWAGTNNFIYYCFTDIEGYIKSGSYKGNANADGTFVYTGFKPAWVIVRSTSGSRHWGIHDTKRSTFNPSLLQIDADDSYAEFSSASRSRDFLSNGFKLRTGDADVNGSETYVYLAFAENPFKYATAR